MNKTLKRKLLLAMAVATLLSTGGLYLLFYTAAGLEWYFNRGFDKAEFQVSIGETEHSLTGSVSLRDVSLKSNLFHLHFSQVDLVWSIPKLLQRKLFIDQLDSNLATLRMSKDSVNTSVNRSALPSASRIERGTIDKLRIISANGTLYNLSNIQLSQIYAHKDLFIDAIDFESSYGKFQLAGNIGISSNDIINLNTKSALFTPVAGFNISGKGTIVGTANQLRFLQKLNAPAATAIEGVVTNPFSNPIWEVSTKLELIETKLIDARWPISIMQGDFVAKGGLNDLVIKGDIDVTDDFNERWKTSVRSHVSNETAVFSITAAVGQKKNRQSINTTGSWNYTSNQPFPSSLDVATDWRNIRWPTTGKSMINSPKGEITFKGDTQVTQFSVDSLQIEPMGIELTKLRLKSKKLMGKENVSQGFSLTGSVVSGKGNLDVSAHINGPLRHLNLSQLVLTGENFSLLRRPEARLVVSPSVSIKNNVSHFDTSGYVSVPKATIRLNNLDNAAYFFTNLINPTLKSNKEGNTDGDQLRILFGDNVWFRGYGLNAQVKGNLQFTNIKDQDIIAKGRLHVINGSYKKAGKKILVKNGFLLYNNMPLDNPELILQLPAKHQTKDKRIAITGRLKTLHSGTSKSTANKTPARPDGHIAYLKNNN